MTAWLTRSPPDLARRLIGASLTFCGVGGVVVETEAYDLDDPASHSFAGPTPRCAAMFGPVGRAYVYRSYGLHWCLNLVCGPKPGGAVLFRALAPIEGVDQMIARRGLIDIRRLAAGPGRLCQALGVNGDHNGLDMTAWPFDLRLAPAPARVVSGPRIGISKAIDLPWRHGLSGSPYLSRPFRA